MVIMTNCTFIITHEMVRKKLINLKMNKAPGVDSVGTRMLIELADEISHTVAELFNKSLSCGDIGPTSRLEIG